MEFCKYQIKDKEKSTWKETVYRNCKLEAKKDGYCNMHHPASIAAAIEREALIEIVSEAREAEKREEAMVGAFMRLRKNDEFKAILAGIREAEDLSNELRDARYR